MTDFITVLNYANLPADQNTLAEYSPTVQTYRLCLFSTRGTKPEQQNAWNPPVHVRSVSWPSSFTVNELVFRATMTASGGSRANMQKRLSLPIFTAWALMAQYVTANFQLYDYYDQETLSTTWDLTASCISALQVTPCGYSSNSY